MVWPNLHSFSNQYIDWIATLTKVLTCMGAAKVAHASVKTMTDLFFKHCCGQYKPKAIDISVIEAYQGTIFERFSIAKSSQ